jgi:hypothetical protein
MKVTAQLYPPTSLSTVSIGEEIAWSLEPVLTQWWRKIYRPLPGKPPYRVCTEFHENRFTHWTVKDRCERYVTANRPTNKVRFVDKVITCAVNLRWFCGSLLAVWEHMSGGEEGRKGRDRIYDSLKNPRYSLGKWRQHAWPRSQMILWPHWINR